MHIIIAPDSFKESLTAEQAALAIRNGFARIYPNAQYTLLPMADGGEGTTDALYAALGGTWHTLQAQDPLGREISVRYLITPTGSAIIETAQASGLQRLAPHERNPLIASTYGTGQIIRHALEQGVQHIILGIGGSATNDGGAGMAQALGARLLNAQDQELPRGGAALQQLHHIDLTQLHPQLAQCRITAACDVQNPLCGTNGASHIFARQKGASDDDIRQLDAALQHYAHILTQHGLPDCSTHAGSGAAGGLAYGLRVFCQAELTAGAELIIQATDLDRHLQHADLLITGEGCIDSQTAFGKIPLALAQRAAAHHVPVIGIGGSTLGDGQALLAQGFNAIFPSVPRTMALPEALQNAQANLERTAHHIAALWHTAQQARPSSGGLTPTTTPPQAT